MQTNTCLVPFARRSHISHEQFCYSPELSAQLPRYTEILQNMPRRPPEQQTPHQDQATQWHLVSATEQLLQSRSTPEYRCIHTDPKSKVYSPMSSRLALSKDTRNSRELNQKRTERGKVQRRDDQSDNAPPPASGTSILQLLWYIWAWKHLNLTPPIYAAQESPTISKIINPRAVTSLSNHQYDDHVQWY